MWRLLAAILCLALPGVRGLHVGSSAALGTGAAGGAAWAAALRRAAPRRRSWGSSSSSRSTEISVTGITTEEESMQLLDASPMSCVRVDPSRHVADFGFAPEDLYDPGELLGAGWEASGARCKRRSGAAEAEAPLAIMVPTYHKDQQYYERFVASARKNLLLGNGSDPVVLVTIFSTMAEGAEMTQNCSVCSSSSSVEGRSLAPSSSSSASLVMRPLVFNRGYEAHMKWRRKINYQAAKKLWALQHGGYDKVLMVDSDFSILRPVALGAALEPYERVLYEVSVEAMPHDQGKWFEEMLQSVRAVLKNSESLTTVPFEAPWIYHKQQVNALVDHLTVLSGGNYTDYIIGLKKKRLFEPVLYRAFVLSKFPTFFQKRVPTTKFFFEDATATESERLAIHPPPIAVRHWLQQRSPCGGCWLEAHGDRPNATDGDLAHLDRE